MSYPTDYMPSWYDKFHWDYSLSMYECFPTVANQTEWSLTSNGGWAGSIVYNLGTCVSMGLATMIQILHYNATGSKARFSNVWIWGNRTGDSNQSDGSQSLSSAFDHLISEGVPYFYEVHPSLTPYVQLPYSTDSGTGTALNLVNTYKSQLSSKASRNRITSYEMYYYYQPEWPTEIDIVKSEVYNIGTTVMLLTAGNEFNNCPSTGIIQDGIDSGGGTHVMNVIGWKNINGNLYWICFNNWGLWGDTQEWNPSGGVYSCKAGICYVPWNFSKIIAMYKIRYNPGFLYPIDSFSWDTAKTTGADYSVTAKEWNGLIGNVNLKITDKGLYPSYFDYAKTGNDFKATNFNQSVNAIKRVNSGLSVTTKTGYSSTGDVNTADTIRAGDLNSLVSAINTV